MVFFWREVITLDLRIEYLADIRKEAGLTQKDMAKLLNCSAANYQQWESGKRKPKYETVSRIANILNVPVAFLLQQDINEQRQTPNHFRIDRLFDDLNATGQEKVIDYAEDMAKIPEYRADPEDEKNGPCEE